MAYDVTYLNAPARGYTWDANGNMLASPALGTLAWDARDQLERAELADGSLTEPYRYDDEGMRTRREVLAPVRAPSVMGDPDCDSEVRDGQPVVSITLREARLGELDAAGGSAWTCSTSSSSVRGAADAAGAADRRVRRGALLLLRLDPCRVLLLRSVVLLLGGHERDASGPDRVRLGLLRCRGRHVGEPDPAPRSSSRCRTCLPFQIREPRRA